MTSPATREVAGRFILESAIGRGGMGTVWRARDTLLGRLVALKQVELPTELDGADRELLRQRVLREARAAASLNHPGAVTVYDVISEGDAAFIAMELFEAPTLSDVVARGGPLPEQEAARMGAEVARVLEEAHRLGIVHRDVKPSNIIVAESGIKLADFGIATVTGDPRITTTGAVLGSPSFMAPEQAMGEAAGAAVDVWGLGVTLYFAMSGHPPFDRGQPIATLNAIVQSDPPPLDRAGPLRDLIGSLLEKAPKDRPTLEEARRSLERIAARNMLETTQRLTGVSSPAEEPVYEPSPGVGAPVAMSDDRPRRLLAWTVAVVLVAAVVGALIWSAARDEPERGERDPRAPSAANRDDDDPAAEEEAAEVPRDAPSAAAGDTEVYQHPAGWTISHPTGWSVVDDALQDGTSTRFEDPASSTYLLVDWQSPPGDDAVAAAEQQSESFAARHDGYEVIALEPATFKGMEAVHWEYSYEDGGARLHAINLQFIVRDDFGFALNFQAREDEWDEVSPLFEDLAETYQPPAP